MSLARTGTGPTLTCLIATTIIALSGPRLSSQSEPSRKETLIINITHAEYRDADGTMILRLVASNSTPRDAVLTNAQLIHISEAGGFLSYGFKRTGKLPRFNEHVVGGSRSQVIEIVSEVDLADFYRDGLEPLNLPEDQRINARAGRLFLAVSSIDGFGKTYQNFFRIGTVAVTRENGRYVRPMVITNGRSLDAFEPDTRAAVMIELMGKR